MALMVFEAIAQTIVGAQVEIAVFIAAVLAHVFLFKKRRTQPEAISPSSGHSSGLLGPISFEPQAQQRKCDPSGALDR